MPARLKNSGIRSRSFFGMFTGLWKRFSRIPKTDFFDCGFSTHLGKNGENRCSARENTLWKTLWKV